MERVGATGALVAAAIASDELFPQALVAWSATSMSRCESRRCPALELQVVLHCMIRLAPSALPLLTLIRCS